MKYDLYVRDILLELEYLSVYIYHNAILSTVTIFNINSFLDSFGKIGDRNWVGAISILSLICDCMLNYKKQANLFIQFQHVKTRNWQRLTIGGISMVYRQVWVWRSIRSFTDNILSVERRNFDMARFRHRIEKSPWCRQNADIFFSPGKSSFA